MHKIARQENKLTVSQVKALPAQNAKKAEAAAVEEPKKINEIFLLSLPLSAW
jgi:hypothetical protein